MPQSDFGFTWATGDGDRGFATSLTVSVQGMGVVSVKDF
jgi:hypothetical protein